MIDRFPNEERFAGLSKGKRREIRMWAIEQAIQLTAGLAPSVIDPPGMPTAEDVAADITGLAAALVAYVEEE